MYDHIHEYPLGFNFVSHKLDNSQKINQNVFHICFSSFTSPIHTPRDLSVKTSTNHSAKHDTATQICYMINSNEMKKKENSFS